MAVIGDGSFDRDVDSDEDVIWDRSFHRHVQGDVDEAMAYYAGIDDRLPRGFFEELEHVYELLETQPLIGPTLRGRWRHMVGGQFSYMLCYRAEGGQVRIAALIHTKRSTHGCGAGWPSALRPMKTGARGAGEC